MRHVSRYMAHWNRSGTTYGKFLMSCLGGVKGQNGSTHVLFEHNTDILDGSEDRGVGPCPGEGLDDFFEDDAMKEEGEKREHEVPLSISGHGPERCGAQGQCAHFEHVRKGAWRGRGEETDSPNFFVVGRRCTSSW